MTTPNRPLFLALALALALVALGATGCHAHAPAPSGWTLHLTTSPNPPTFKGNTSLALHAATAAGQPLTGATVSADLVMTTMDMGPNHVVLAAQGDGDYVGVGNFTMAGPWKVNVTVSAAGHTQTASFPENVQ